MSDWIRLMATGFIWLMLAIMVNTVNDTVPVAFILGIAATISTLAIWESAKHQNKTASEQASKLKRNDRVSRLVDKLNEDEVYELQELLAARHDEQYVERR